MTTYTDKVPNVSSRAFKRTKILATVGPASDSYDHVLGMMKNGANGFRLNFSHGDHAEHGRRIEWIRQASKEYGKPVAVLQDLQGPKIRLGDFEGRIEVKTGDALQFKFGANYEEAGIIPIQYDLSKKMKVGERLFLFDGRLRGIVADISDDGVLTVQIDNDGFLLKRKGMNLPDTDFGGDILTPKDLRDIDYGVTQDIDYVALSFVQSADDIVNLRKILTDKGSDARIIAKIETQAAIEDDVLEEIVKVSDGVMVARGDLAVEVSPEAVPVIQRNILGFCQKHGKISIVATQMLISMVDNPDPTRAEVSDVATAVFTGADCVMLSDESANGKYPLESVATMKRVIRYAEQHPLFKNTYQIERERTLANAISSSVINMADSIGASAIVAETTSGATAFAIASRRPAEVLFAVTDSARTAQQLALAYDVKSYWLPADPDAAQRFISWLSEKEVLQKGEIVVSVSGREPGVRGTTDTIRVGVVK